MKARQRKARDVKSRRGNHGESFVVKAARGSAPRGMAGAARLVQSSPGTVSHGSYGFARRRSSGLGLSLHGTQGGQGLERGVRPGGAWHGSLGAVQHGVGGCGEEKSAGAC